VQEKSHPTTLSTNAGTTVIGMQTTNQTCIRPLLPQRFNSTSQPWPRSIVQPELNSVSQPKTK
jgi:hypothetical protein